MKSFDVIIIGCGASGTMCALASNNKSIAIIDSAIKPAKKILVTGNGRCNLTNVNLNSNKYNQNIDKYLEKFSVKDTLNFFNSIGLEYYYDEEGRVYPISNSAKSVVDVLVNQLKQKAEIFCENTVSSIEKVGKSFVVKTNKDIFSCNKLVIATGGSFANEIAKLGIKSKEFVPSLVSLKSKTITEDLNGIRLSNVKVTAKNQNGKTKSDKGEILFKTNGISGIVIFNISTIFARDNLFKGGLTIDLLPEIDDKLLAEKLKNRKTISQKMSGYFVGMFQPPVANLILKIAKIDTNLDCKNLSNTQIDSIVKVIKNLQFTIDGCFDNNQVFSGGIELKNLTENMMSKQIENLYIVGEICDVDGECGGYNLQWAWTSGHIAGVAL